MACEFKHSLRLVIQRMMVHQLGSNVLSQDLFEKFTLFRPQQIATSTDYFSCAITAGGMTEARVCLTGEYIHAAFPIDTIPGIGLAGKRDAIVKTKDPEELRKLLAALVPSKDWGNYKA